MICLMIRRHKINHKNCNKLLDWQAGYIAGLIDGEGCIHIRKDNQVQLQITQMVERDMGFLIDMLGVGYIYNDNFKGNNPNRYTAKLQKKYFINRSLALLTLFTQIEPFIFWKKEKIRLAIKLLQKIEHYR